MAGVIQSLYYNRAHRSIAAALWIYLHNGCRHGWGELGAKAPHPTPRFLDPGLSKNTHMDTHTHTQKNMQRTTTTHKLACIADKGKGIDGNVSPGQGQYLHGDL